MSDTLRLRFEYDEEDMETVDEYWSQVKEEGYEPFYEMGVLAFLAQSLDDLEEYLGGLDPEKVYLRVRGRSEEDDQVSYSDTLELHPEEASWEYPDGFIERLREDYDALVEEGFVMTYSGGGSPHGASRLREALGDDALPSSASDPEVLDVALEDLEEMEFALFMQVYEEDTPYSATVRYTDTYNPSVEVRPPPDGDVDADEMEEMAGRIRDALSG